MSAAVRTAARAAQEQASVDELLDAAVGALGGTARSGQQEMARAVAAALETGEHLLVQAGTGTGKSLGYLVPAVAHAVAAREPVVVSTATLALQAQVVDRDLPRLADALEPLLRRRVKYALVKGRSNYLCRHKLHGGFPEDDGGDALFGPSSPTSVLGREVQRLRAWAEETTSGDRDELDPGTPDRAWRQVSVGARECLGAQRCPAADECFVERSREAARRVDVVVTNHALLAIDAFEGRQVLPEHDLVVVDEAHELADRVTSVVSEELSAAGVQAAARAVRGAGGSPSDLEAAAAALEQALDDAPLGRFASRLPAGVLDAAVLVREGARTALSGLKEAASGGTSPAGGDEAGGRAVARARAQEVLDVAERLAVGSEHDVVWLAETDRRGRVLHVAPLSVAGLLRTRFFPDRTVVATSATLTVGGTFDAAAGALGLTGDDAPAWRGVDVGSPFDYRRQGVLYVARHLPPPGRDGLSDAVLDEIAALVEAVGGRTLGLFSSRRAAERAAESMRERLDVPVLCQGDDATPLLVRRFARDAATCLFGTLSLWQGVDVPGPACQLVLVDRIPFPRPDDPLASARAQAVSAAGGNGFMTVSGAHAALRLAQGVGRLVRSGADRGVVAVLDPRLATARYGGYLRASLPPFWATTDREVVLAALRRLDAAAGDPWPVADPLPRASGAAGPAGRAPSPRSSRAGVTAGRAWTPEEDAGLRAGAAAGRALEVLAGRYDASPEQVAARLEALGVER